MIYLHIKNIAIEDGNVAIGDENKSIENKNVAIEDKLKNFRFNIQSIKNIKKIHHKYGKNKIFGRGDVSETCQISYSAAGVLIAKMKSCCLIKEIKGYGKGKYRFD